MAVAHCSSWSAFSPVTLAHRGRRGAFSVQAAAAPSQPAAAPRVVVIGGGWAGFGATKALTDQGYDVTLLDASPNPGGLSAGWRTPQGRAVEAGIKVRRGGGSRRLSQQLLALAPEGAPLSAAAYPHRHLQGFWYQYANIFALIDELGLDRDAVLTPFTTSGFWSPRGLTTQAPVFSQQPRLPAILGQFVHTSGLFNDTLPLFDRATIIPWLYSAIDLNSSPGSYERYDQMTAREVFKAFGVTQKAYEEFLKPTLLVRGKERRGERGVPADQ